MQLYRDYAWYQLFCLIINATARNVYVRTPVTFNDQASGKNIIKGNIGGSPQDCGNSIALATELPQSYTKPSISHNIFQAPVSLHILMCCNNFKQVL